MIEEKENVLIIGARSDIALATAHQFANKGYNIELAGRKVYTLDKEKLNIEIKNKVQVKLHELDVLDVSTYDNFINSLIKLPNIVICTVGFMGEQKKNERDIQAAKKVMRTNYEGPVNILSKFANYFEKRGSGTIVGVSSVAGERGRATNYVYGSAKAGLTAYLSGLRNRLSKKNIQVITVLPGFVATKMTKDMHLPEKLTAKPDEVGIAIYNAVKKKKDVIYIKKIWRFIMAIIKIMPEKIFKKIKI